MKTKLWNIISNPPIIKINGIRVPSWQVPSIEDRGAMIDAIVNTMPKKRKNNPGYNEAINDMVVNKVV